MIIFPIILFLLIFFVPPAKADYPGFPLPSLYSTQKLGGKDSFRANISFGFSRWEKKLPGGVSRFEKTEFITIPKLLNFTWEIRSAGRIVIEDFDVKLGGEYFFSKNVLSSFSLFLRRRRFADVSSVGFGDVFLSVTLRGGERYLEYFLGVGGFIPLAGDPDEELATLTRVNVSSFGVDIPIYLFARTEFNLGVARLFLIPYLSYIRRMSYIFFGQVISPGDLTEGRFILSLVFPRFFVTPSGFAPDLIISTSPQFIFGFPEFQRTEIYTVTGKAWQVARIKFSISSLFRYKVKEEEGKIREKEKFFLDLSFMFTLLERNFLSLGDTKYAIYRVPFMDRLKPGFSSEFSLGFFF